MLYMNMWELLHQLEYVRADQRAVVYSDIEHIKQEIERVIDLLVQHDRSQHP
jgi:ABC-type Na+ transport system ATPase subunit NatA